MKSFRFVMLSLFIALSVFAADKPELLFAKDSVVGADCAFATVQVEYKHSKAVFVGKVISIIENENSKTFEFKVEKYLKGVKGKKIKIAVGKTMRFEPIYQTGKSYLIYAFADEKGVLRTGKCTRGPQIEFAKEDLKVLGKAKVPR